MTREEFETELHAIQDEVTSAYGIIRQFRTPDAVTFATRCVLMDCAEAVTRRVKMLMLRSGRTVAVSCTNRVNAPFYPPSVDIRASLLNFDNNR